MVALKQPFTRLNSGRSFAPARTGNKNSCSPWPSLLCGPHLTSTRTCRRNPEWRVEVGVPLQLVGQQVTGAPSQIGVLFRRRLAKGIWHNPLVFRVLCLEVSDDGDTEAVKTCECTRSAARDGIAGWTILSRARPGAVREPVSNPRSGSAALVQVARSETKCTSHFHAIHRARGPPVMNPRDGDPRWRRSERQEKGFLRRKYAKATGAQIDINQLVVDRHVIDFPDNFDSVVTF